MCLCSFIVLVSDLLLQDEWMNSAFEMWGAVETRKTEEKQSFSATKNITQNNQLAEIVI